MTPKHTKKWTEILRRNSAGYGFVTDESIEAFEEQFVIPTILQAQQSAVESYKERLLEKLPKEMKGKWRCVECEHSYFYDEWNSCLTKVKSLIKDKNI